MEAGFTLVELLVALVISGLLSGVIFQVLSGQSRFTQFQSARQEVQQNTRGAMELIASELRAVPVGGITTAERGLIRFYLPRVWGVLCQTNAAGTQVDFLVPKGLFPTDFKAQNAGWGVAVRRLDVAVSDWGYGGMAQQVSSPSPAACQSNYYSSGSTLSPLPGDVQNEHFEVPVLTGTGTMQAGDPVFVYQRVEYDVRTADSGPLTGTDWIYRTMGYKGDGSQIRLALAGPVGIADAPGLAFKYYNAAGAALPSPVATPADIRSIGVRVITQSRAKFNDKQQVDTAFTVVHLRND